ncbi:DNA translocase FtsK [Candidatus Saccharibacteria bacterium]|nr:DNA translocase FtsK [Candidatus Saccharibacteria bacterium]
MAKRKTRKKAPVKSAPKHVVPNGFWVQTTAILLLTFSVLLLVAMVGVGGPAPEFILDASRATFGVMAYVLPLLLGYFAIQLFREEEKRPSPVPVVVSFFCLSFIAGFAHLFVADPTRMALASAGQGGGLVGYGIDSLAFNFFDELGTGITLLVLALISFVFVLKTLPADPFMRLWNWFKNDYGVAENEATASRLRNPLSGLSARRAAAAEAGGIPPEPIKSAPIGELKLNRGVPTLDQAAGDDAPKEQKGLSSLRNSVKPDKAAEEQAALTTKNDPTWVAPSVDLLEKKQSPANAGDVKANAQIIQDTLAEFNINVEMEGANIGPKVTQYTLKPPAGVKLTRITQLETNIALNLAAQAIRIEAPIPGQRAVGIEVPNIKAADVRLSGILNSKAWTGGTQPLAFAVGKDIAGEAVVGELNKMPHLLIAGQTGSGKSVMINTLLTSLLYRNSPAEMKLILVDPKQVEMAPYEDIPHLLTPVITQPEKCISALKWAVNEMERRYSLLAEEKVRDIKSYNERQRADGETMPYIVIVIDELADLMMLAARDVEALIVRLAQKARAVGIHLVLATQRPSVDVITGLIKANVPARIAFTVASQIDSRTILDQMGAEKLLGQGDMLMLTPSMSKPRRIQGAWVTDDEVMKVTDHIRLQRAPEYDDEVVAQAVQLGKGGNGSNVVDFDGGGGSDDDMYNDAVRVVVEAGKASTSLLQRRLRIGYSRAARIIEELEEQGVIGPADGSRPREVLMRPGQETASLIDDVRVDA